MAIILEENHDLPLCKLQITQRVGSTSDQTAAGTAAYGGPALSGLCNFASELERRGAGGRTRARGVRPLPERCAAVRNATDMGRGRRKSAVPVRIRVPHRKR